MASNDGSSGLDPFHPAVERWFCENYADPTPPQALGFMYEDQELIYYRSYRQGEDA